MLVIRNEFEGGSVSRSYNTLEFTHYCRGLARGCAQSLLLNIQLLVARYFPDQHSMNQMLVFKDWSQKHARGIGMSAAPLDGPGAKTMSSPSLCIYNDDPDRISAHETRRRDP